MTLHSLLRRSPVLGLVFLASVGLAAPGPDEVAAAQESRGGTCVMFTNGVCICDQYEARILDLTCQNTATPDEFICSYNVIFQDVSGMSGNFTEQRMDVFRPNAEGGWKLVSEYRPPVNIQ